MQSFNERVIKKEYKNIILPIKQLLLIDTKVLKNPDNLISIFKKYSERKDLPDEVKTSLLSWNKRLGHWRGNKFLKNGLTNDADVEAFIKNELSLLKGSDLKEDHDVDLLFASGMLSNYLFENTETKKAPEISYWLGWSEKHLRREDYFGSGDLFLKQCIRRYPAHPVAKECLKEYKESVEFEFSGSGGTNIPEDVSKELDELTKLVKHK